jgi:hypothetical protein
MISSLLRCTIFNLMSNSSPISFSFHFALASTNLLKKVDILKLSIFSKIPFSIMTFYMENSKISKVRML